MAAGLSKTHTHPSHEVASERRRLPEEHALLEGRGRRRSRWSRASHGPLHADLPGRAPRASPGAARASSRPGMGLRPLPRAQPTRHRCTIVQASIRRRRDAAGSSKSHSGLRHDCCLGRSQQGSAAGTSRSRSGLRHDCCLGRSQQGSAAGTSRSRSGLRHGPVGSSRLASGRRIIRCLGRSQQGSAAGTSRSRSGWHNDRRWVVHVGLREEQRSLPWAQPTRQRCGSARVSIRQCQDRACGIRCAPVDARGGVRVPGCRSERCQDRCCGVRSPSGQRHDAADLDRDSRRPARPTRQRPTHPAQPRNTTKGSLRLEPGEDRSRFAPDSQVGTRVGLTSGIKLRARKSRQDLDARNHRCLARSEQGSEARPPSSEARQLQWPSWAAPSFIPYQILRGFRSELQTCPSRPSFTRRAPPTRGRWTELPRGIRNAAAPQPLLQAEVPSPPFSLARSAFRHRR